MRTTAGNVRGVAEGGIRVFKGVPFAAPPVGELRWKPPQPVEGWGSATLRADSYGPQCMQAPVFEEEQ